MKNEKEFLNLAGKNSVSLARRQPIVAELARKKSTNNFVHQRQDDEMWDLCPYNRSHVILKSKMSTHLSKCRLRHPNAQFSICPFNSSHHLPPQNLQNHIENCDSRKKLESEMYVAGEPKSEVRRPFKVEMPTCSENWDEEPPVPSYLDVINDVVMSKPVYRVPFGMSKSEKKVFYKKEAERFEKLLSKVPSGLQNYSRDPPNSGPSSYKWGENQDFANYLEPQPAKNEPDNQFQAEGRCSSAGRGFRLQ